MYSVDMRYCFSETSRYERPGLNPTKRPTLDDFVSHTMTWASNGTFSAEKTGRLGPEHDQGIKLVTDRPLHYYREAYGPRIIADDADERYRCDVIYATDFILSSAGFGAFMGAIVGTMGVGLLPGVALAGKSLWIGATVGAGTGACVGAAAERISWAQMNWQLDKMRDRAFRFVDTLDDIIEMIQTQKRPAWMSDATQAALRRSYAPQVYDQAMFEARILSLASYNEIDMSEVWQEHEDALLEGRPPPVRRKLFADYDASEARREREKRNRGGRGNGIS